MSAEERGGPGPIETWELKRSPEHAQVHKWRQEQLCALGFGEAAAELLADCIDVDLGRVRSLVRAGCLPDLVLRIVL
jgi:hypothetical protein